MDYIPKKESEKVIWNNNLSAKISTVGGDVGLDPTTIIAIQNICNANSSSIVANDDAQKAAQTAKAEKDTQLKVGEKAIRETVRVIKSSNKYTTAIGRNLGIIGEDPTVDYSTYQPKIKASVMSGHVKIVFVKDGLNGMHIYGRVKGELKWVKLAYDTYSPYNDSRPLAVDNVPEHREYMAIGVIRDEEVTLQSDIVEAVFGG
ncbi:hypothetical protein [Flavobacterium sp. SM2513]|uniref:hypothetical protein n=1 Tax=Flavobacterium sp. SM2513 TaxID=3424766 RepID=UPI003D7FD16B